MADWVNIIDSAVDPDAPLTSELAYAWRDNPIAIAEGAAGAPKVMGRALNIGIGNLTGTNAIVNLDAAREVFIFGTIVTNAVAGVGIGYQLSSNNGGSWGSAVSLGSVSSPGGGSSISGASIVNMVGFNAIRLSKSGGALSDEPNGCVFYIRGV